MYFYISFILFSLSMCVLSASVVTRAGLEAVAARGVALQLFAEVNNTSGDECEVTLRPARCCLAGDRRCDVLQLAGGVTETVPPGATRTLHLVAPLLGPYQRRGYCSVRVEYRAAAARPRRLMRDTLTVKFDTSLHRASAPGDVTPCDQPDQDPLNDCKPVHCDTYYNGRRSYYNVNKKRCVEVPVCLANADTEVPTRAYNPVSNQCVNKPSISEEDIQFIKTLTGSKSRQAKEILIIRTIEKNCSISPKDKQQSHYDSDTVSKVVGVKSATSVSRTAPPSPPASLASNLSHVNCFLSYVASNRHMLLALSGVVLLQCCLICAMVYCFTRSCACCKKKEVVRKFFNYRQDASVTTPLICTSNIDTETTDYQYLSESSNYIDKKIRCYKACQKERKTSVKLSMSDDILSKCITRRDWRHLPRSETIPEARIDEDRHAERKDISLQQRKLTDVKVNFQDEKQETKKPISVKSIVKKENNRSDASFSDLSEKVLRCHSYNYEASSNVLDLKKSSHSRSKTFGIYKHEKNAGSIEQGAQAYFSNDSIDDFLSERGVLFIGDNASRYSFTSISSAANSSRSSKTSKNNGSRNVIPFLSRKSKGPSSDPGLKKSKVDLDLELLHISRASMCSSSNDSDLCKDLKRTKDSTSSL